MQQPASPGGPGADFFTRLALRRVQAGEIRAAEGGYVAPRGRTLNVDIAGAVQRLREQGCVALGAAGPDGLRPVMLTAAGAVMLDGLADPR